MEKKESAGQGVKESALRYEHREEKVFPSEVGLEVLELSGVQNRKASEASVEKKCRDGKCTAPAPKGPSRESRASKAGPDQPSLHGDADEEKQAVPQIRAQRVAQGNTGENRARRPEIHAARKVADELNVKGDVTEVVGRENPPLVADWINQPQESPQRRDGENRQHQNIPRAGMASRVRAGLTERPDSSGQACRQGGHCHVEIQAAKCKPETNSSDHTCSSGGEHSRSQPVTAHGVAPVDALISGSPPRRSENFRAER